MRSKSSRDDGRSAGKPSYVRRGLGVAGAVALLSVPTILLLGHGAAVESAIAAAIADPASILAARSPGGRAPGALSQSKLIQTKRRYARSGVKRPAGPTERVLGQARTRPTDALPLGDAVDPLIGTPFAIPQGAFGDVAGDGPAPVGPGAVGFAGTPITGIGIGGGGGGGGVGGGGGGDGGTTPVVPPVSAVPEPSTWLMTIFGFFAAGIGLRRRRPASVGRQRAA